MLSPVTIQLDKNGDIQSVDWQAWILQELKTPSPQAEVAKTYSYLWRTNPHADWAKVNAVIIKRWSKAGLQRVKTLAWQILEAENRERL